MARFVIEGGVPLNGSIRPAGNKNEALPALMACLLTDQPVTYRRVPKIADVLTVCAILEDLGAKVEWLSEESLRIDAGKVNSHTPSGELCEKVRASILLIGPLLARMGKIELALPGGDVIGARRIDTHFEGVEALGGKLKFGQTINATIEKIVGADVFMDEPSVTATENLLMLSVLCEGTTVLHNAASEPHVVGLCKLLNAMGARISGLGSNVLTVLGVKSLSGADHTIGPDFMEVGSFLCLGAIAKGKITIEDVQVSDMRFVLKSLSKIGINPEIRDNSLFIDGTKPLAMRKEISGRIGTIYSQPWPAYPTDLMSVAIVAATQSKGTMVFFEKMFEAHS